MILPIDNKAQKFPKTLRFYYFNKEDGRRYIRDNRDDAGTDSDSTVIPKNYKLNGNLRDEQKFMVEKINNNCNGVIHMGTGKGKSWVIFDTVLKKRVRTLILTHNIATANDIYNDMKTLTDIKDEELGLYHSQTRKSFTGKIDVTTHSSFKNKRKELVGKYDMILYDECDYNLSFPKKQDYDCMVWALIMMDTKYLYWFTGTPYRAEGGKEVLERIFGDIWTYEGDKKYHHIPKITSINYTYKGTYLFESWHELRDEIMEDIVRVEKQVAVVEKLKGASNLVLVKGVAEAERLASMIPGSLLVHWQLGVKETKDIIWRIAAMDKGWQSMTIVWTIDKIGRGVNIRSLDTIFLFSPVRFRGTIVQAVWRILREFEGKTEVHVVDWNDKPILNKQANERTKTYGTEYGVEEDDIEILDANNF